MHVKRRKKIEGRKRKLSPVRQQTCIAPSWNHEPSSELLRFVRGVCPKFRQTGQFFTTSSWWHDINQARFHVFLIIFNFFGIKMPWHSMLNCVIAVRPICLKIPSNLLHISTQKYDFSKRYG